MGTAKKIVLVTGGNTGVGYDCCLTLAKQENTHVIVAGRSQERIDAAVTMIKAVAASSSIVESGLVDLASLKSVRKFARRLIERNLHFFSVVGNAAIVTHAKTHTEDGFESTISINHIGHFLLFKLLQDRTKRIIVVGSEVHDPVENTGTPSPNVSDLSQMAKGYATFNGPEAYTTSKLCNMLYANEFVRRFPSGPEIVAFSPGFVPDTELGREAPAFVWFIMQRVIRIRMWLTGGRVSTPAYSGACLARVASENLATNGWNNGDYVRIDELRVSSTQARDPVLGKALWDKSEEWVSPFVQ